MHYGEKELGSKELIRDINSTLVLETIIEERPVSRASLSKRLGLTKATISSIVQEWLNKDILMEIGCGSASIGRKPTLLTINEKAGYSLSIDLSVDQIDFMATDLLGQCLYKTSCPASFYYHTSIPETIFQFIDNFLDKFPKNTYGIIGITIAIHGVVKENAIIFTPYYDLSDYGFPSVLSDRYHVPIYLYNEANLAVLGENTFSSHAKNIAYIGVSSGIGLGMILNGRLYCGADGNAGEFGHTIIALDGRKCPCGNRGCLEQYGSERALMADFAALKHKESIKFEDFEALYQQGDKDAGNIAEQFVKIISAGTNNLLNLYNPEIIVLNSRFTSAFPHLLEEIKKQLVSKTHCSKKIKVSALQDDAVLYGAAYINITKFLKISYFNPLKIQ